MTKPKAKDTKDTKTPATKAKVEDVALAPNPTLEQVLSDLYSARSMKKTAESIEANCKALLAPMVDGVADQFPDAALLAGPWRIKRTAGSSVHVDASILLEKGVQPEIVEAATVRSSYYQYRVAQIKIEGESADA
jgi:hypothetical protein